MKKMVSLLLAFLLSMVFAVGLQAQSLDCANPTSVIPDGRLNSSTIPAGAVFWFALSSSQALASYSVEANFPQGAATMPTLAVLAAPCPGSAVTTRDTTALTPEAPNGQRLSFLKTSGPAATFLIRVENPGGSSQALTLRVSETTQVSPRWSTFGGFYTTWGFTNTTNALLNVTLQVFAAGNPVPVATASFGVGAGEATFRDTRPSDLNVAADQAGSVLAIQDGPPGAVLADGFMSNESGAVFVVIPVKFTEVRAGQASGGGEGMAMGGGGGVNSVTAGDASITIGGTMTDPTVRVSDLGITTAKLADANVTPAKLSFTPGTVTSLTEGTGIDLTPDTITGTGSIGVNLAGPGVATSVARSDHTHAVSGANSTGVGVNALAINSGFGNTALGANALDVNTGGNNTAVGNDALGANTTGFSNIAIGDRALATNMTGPQNVAVGTFALFDNTAGSDNTALGHHALENNTTANSNTAVGSFALAANTIGTSNTALGASALGGNTGSSNTAVGVAALAQNTASGNTAVGAFALDANTSGTGNTAVGLNALGANTTGVRNAAVGDSALDANTIGSDNTALGSEALTAVTNGGSNTAVGSSALAAITNTSSNTAVGNSALRNSIGGGNTAVGSSALFASTTADSNTALGSQTLAATTSGFENSAVGAFALDANNFGSRNTAMGFNALGNFFNTNTSDNIAIGWNAGSAVMSGSNNILVGNSGASSDANTIRIGIPSGGAAHTATFIGGIRGVTTAVADAIPVLIDSNGQLGTVSSTRRVKEDIRDMGAASAGLLHLRPVTFRYKQPSADGSKPIQYGLIAEEVAELMPEIVVYDADGQPRTVQYHVLPALLLNELQRQEKELAAMNAELQVLRAQQKRLEALEAELAEWKAALRPQRAARTLD